MAKILQFPNQKGNLEHMVTADASKDKVSPGMAVYYMFSGLIAYLHSRLNNRRSRRVMGGVGLYMSNLSGKELPRIMHLAHKIKSMPPAQYGHFMEEVVSKSRFVYGARLGNLYFDLCQKYIDEPHLKVVG